MRDWREEFTTLLSSNEITSLVYWAKILNLFEEHKLQMTVDEIQILADTSERCRVYHNTDKEEVKEIVKNGKILEITIIKKGIGIEKNEVSPKIYQYLEQIIKEHDKKTDVSTRTDFDNIKIEQQQLSPEMAIVAS